MDASAVAVRLANHDARLESHHNAIGVLRDSAARHETKIQVITTELRETREDIADMKTEMRDGREEQKDEMKWIRRGMWTAAAAFTGFMLTLGGLIVTLANHG